MSFSDSEHETENVDVHQNDWQKKKRRKMRKETVIRDKKVKGEEHVNHKGRVVAERMTGPDSRCSRLKCFDKVDNNQRISLLNQFNSFKTKDEQDSHLSGLLSFHAPARRRPRSQRQHNNVSEESHSEDENNGADFYAHNGTYKYKVRCNKSDISVCSKAFLSMHGISRARLRRIQNTLLYEGCSPKDKRGKHSNRYNKTPELIQNLIMRHIESFKPRTSHYSLRCNPNRRFLPEDLSVTKMHKMFFDLHRINVSYQVYYNIFHDKYNIHFGVPRSDTCSFCDSTQQQIERETDEAEKNRLNVEKQLHIKKADKFHELKRFYKKKAQEGKITMVSFDFMQNLPLPHIRTSDVFYARQLWYYVFGLHDIGQNKVNMMVYDECTGKKGQNDVTSMLFKHMVMDENVREDLVLISDGCSGQNKNYVMVRFLYMLVHCLKMFKSITYLFPIRGHSYLPNDQDFSLIGSKKRTHTAEIKEDWDKIILEARINPSPFNLVKIQQSDLFDMATSLSPYFRKVPKPPMRLKDVRVFKISQDDIHVNVRHSYSGPWESICIRNNTKLPKELNFIRVYKNPIPLKPAKLQDIKRLSAFLKDPDKKAFYDSLTSAQVANNDDDSADQDDNSSGDENV